jgi:hypothetical protein
MNMASLLRRLMGGSATDDQAVLTPTQLSASRALLHFCGQHQMSGVYVDALARCAEALERGDLRAALAARAEVHLGKDGFNDLPVLAVPGESLAYANTVFRALTAYWATMMSLSEKP